MLKTYQKMPQQLQISVGRNVGCDLLTSSEIAQFRRFPLDDGDPYGSENDHLNI